MARPPKPWTIEMLERLVTEYAITPTKDLAKRLGMGVNTVRRKAEEMDLCKSKLYRTSYKTWVVVEQMYGKHTFKQMAVEAGVSERTITRIAKRLKQQLDKDDRRKTYRNASQKMLASEQRRLVFGLPTRTDRHIGKNKYRMEIARQLAQHGYIVIKNSMTMYYCDEMQRYEYLEEYAKACGFCFKLWNQE